MTVRTLLAPYDEAALIALANKGTFVRARKDVTAGQVKVSTQNDDFVAGQVGDAKVTLTGTRIEDARCDCPATGMCRHILALILTLQASAGPADGQGTVSESVVPVDPVIFSHSEIETFAGADWANAIDLASQANVVAADPAMTRKVTFPDHKITVTIPSGFGLRKALFKGPKDSWKRRAVAAAALGLAQSGGQDLPDFIDTETPLAVDPQVLDRAANALCAAALGLATGNLTLARDHLFEVAISTRAEAAPRLAAELRTISKAIDDTALRKADTIPVDLFRKIAQTHALVRALRQRPTLPALLGQLSRTYVTQGPKTLLALGAEVWRNVSGAKGFTIYFCDLNAGTVHRHTVARAAGTDLRFDPYSQWNVPLWRLDSPQKLLGRIVEFPDMAAAPDGALAQSQTAQRGTDFADTDQVRHLSVSVDEWGDLAALGTTQVGEGLLKRPGEGMALLWPETVTEIHLDEIEQKRFTIWSDAKGNDVWVVMPDQMAGAEQNWAYQRSNIQAGLVAFEVTPHVRRARLVSVWLMGNATPVCVAKTRLPAPGTLQKLKANVRSKFTLERMPEPAPPNALGRFYEKGLETLLYNLGNASPLSEVQLAQASALGQSAIITHHDLWQQSGDFEDALALAYVLTLGCMLCGDGS